MYVRNVANSKFAEIKNIFKCLGGVDKLKVRTLRGRGCLENVGKRKKGRGSTIDEIQRT